MAPTTRSRTSRMTGLPDTDDSGSITENHDPQPVTSSSAVRRQVQSRTEKLSSPVPVYTIDLSRPPTERYLKLARDFEQEIKDLPTLFDDLVLGFGHRPEVVHRWARRILRRVHSDEQTEELRGISIATGVPMYLLVCFNTLLDLLMGCSSGGIRATVGSDGSRMLHYRTLDWGMDLLRRVVVQLEFIEKPKGPVIARSITYAGFVGILTGVRKTLSLSLNFRPYHNHSDSKIANVRFYGHLLFVLLGWRPSISSKLRELILPSRGSATPLPDLRSIVGNLPRWKSTAAYLIFSDGDTTAVLEKDLATAEILQSNEFISCTNHDAAERRDAAEDHAQSQVEEQRNTIFGEDFLLESVERKECMVKLWKRYTATRQRKAPGVDEGDTYPTEADIVKWVQKWPITNETTHYACIMDPVAGEMLWTRLWAEPLPSP